MASGKSNERIVFCLLALVSFLVLTTYKSYTYLKALSDTLVATMDGANTLIDGVYPADSSRRPPLDLWDELDVLSGGRDPQGAARCDPPMVYFQNVIVRPNRTTNNHHNNRHSSALLSKPYPDLIPKILHFTMRSRCVPRDLARTLNRWREVLPDYSIFFHDDDAVDRLVYGHEWDVFPNLLPAIKCILYKGAMYIDVWRVLLLYKYGGVYSDIDNWPFEGFTNDTIRTDLSAFFFTDGYGRPSQWFMATEPRHPIMYLSMQHIIQNLLDMKSIQSPRTVFVTGPDAVKKGYLDFLLMNGKERKIFPKSGIISTGMQGKMVLKQNKFLPARGDKREKIEIVGSKHGYGDLVDFNETLKNITRQKRIQLESGMIHWQKEMYKAQIKVRKGEIEAIPRGLTCRQYLDRIESGSLSESASIRISNNFNVVRH